MKVKEILQKYGHHKEQLLKVLHEIQEADPRNHISPGAMQEVAQWMHLPLSSVYGVLKYYSMYSTEPRGKHLIRVCNSVVCMMHGSEGVKEQVEKMVTALEDKQSGGALFTVETTECLGHCEAAPTLMINEDIIGPVHQEEVAALIHPLKIKSI